MASNAYNPFCETFICVAPDYLYLANRHYRNMHARDQAQNAPVGSGCVLSASCGWKENRRGHCCARLYSLREGRLAKPDVTLFS
jgi:hypothetical protein